MKEQDILDQIFETGTVITEVELIAGKLYATVSSLGSEDQLKLERDIPGENSGSWYVIHKYSRDILKYTLKKYGDKTFSTPEEAENFLKPLSGSILDKLIKEQNALEKELRRALKLEKVEEHFFVEGELEDGSEQSPKESISGSQEA